MKTTKQLLKLSDDELLLAAAPAYWGLKGKKATRPIRQCTCRDCKSQVWDTDPTEELIPIPCCCIEKVAFEMRDACDYKMFRDHLYLLCHDGFNFIEGYFKSTAKQQIVAAMLSWEAQG